MYIYLFINLCSNIAFAGHLRDVVPLKTSYWSQSSHVDLTDLHDSDKATKSQHKFQCD